MYFVATDNLTEIWMQVLVMIILVPLPLFFAHTVYGVKGLTAWVVIGIIWTFFSAFSVVLYPLFESRVALLQIGKGMIKVRRLTGATSRKKDTKRTPLGCICKRKWKIRCSRRADGSLSA
jgi:hypothetical protein